MLSRNVLLAAAIAAFPLVAQAQPVTGLYIGGGAGFNFMQDENFTSPSGGGKLGFGIGATGVISLGWGFGNGLRAEIEGDYRWNTIRHFGSDSEQKYGPMVNVLYDFTMLSPAVVPYVGVGVGYQWAKISGSGFGETAGSFAAQGIVGAAFPIAPIPGLAVTTEARFMALTEDRDYSNGIKANTDLNYSLLIGLRYAFNAPPPPPPAPMAAPAPAPARSYLVFFDWDKATLTPRAQQIIAEAAANSTKVKYTQIQVNGYTDTSGTPQYNQGLSIRRAQAVAAELVKDGVPKGAIAIQGFGETHLLVPTGPGVREPQNRRVEIIIR